MPIISDNLLFYLKVYSQYFLRNIARLYFKIFIKVPTVEEVLSFCSKRVPYYMNRGNDINNYPYISKHNVIQNFKSMISDGVIRLRTSTSGTTGTPCDLLRGITSIIAESYYQNQYFGWNSKYRVIVRADTIFDWTKKPGKIFKKIPFIKELYVSSFHINDEKLKSLVDKLESIGNKCLWAYPSTAYLIADYCLRNKRQLKFDLVITSSEILFEYQIPVIEKAFGCKIKDWYGLAERVAAFYRCDAGNYHEIPGYSYIEFVHRYDEIYEIVGTSFYNKIMPLVRYKTGDFVKFNHEPCLCGNKGVNISSILGRDDDFIDLPDKKLPGILLNAVFNNVKNVKECQVVQKKDKNIVVRIVRNKDYNQTDDEILRDGFCKLLPAEMCSFENVKKIDRGKKFKFIIKE